MIHTNKVRRILRAKNGSQIPKFQNPAGPFQLSSFWTNPTLNTQTSSIFGQSLSNSFASNYSNALYNPTTLGSQIAAPKPNSIDVSGKLDNAVKSFASRFDADAETERIKQQIKNNSLSGKVGNFISKNSALVGMGLDYLGNQFNDTVNSNTFDNVTGGLDAASNLVGTVNPQMGLALKGASTVAKIVNSIGGKKSDNFSSDKWTLSQIGGSYGGSVATINNAQSKAGQKYGLFNNGARKKANRLIAEAKRQQGIMTDIAEEASDQKALAGNDLNYIQYNMDINGGYDQRYIRAAKSGMKLSDKISLIKSRKYVDHYIDLNSKQVEEFAKGGTLDWEPTIDIFEPVIEIPEFQKGGQIEENWEPIIEILDNLPEYKSGGKTQHELETPEIEETTQKNIIPEGALHKNKHHIEHTEGLTKKGIPVVDNEGNQQAEVEKEEIIFNLEVTKKLEELYKDYYDSDKSQKEKDEAAIEAGKLLVYQILFNTDDRTGLIKRCEEGGKL